MIVLAIDPGPTKSAWLIFGVGTDSIYAKGIADNDDLRSNLLSGTWGIDRVVIEKVESFGMAVGAEVFETVFWSGRFAEAARPVAFDRVTRRQVKITLCGSMRAKDGNIRQALIDRYGGSAAIGKKASPGPLYGIANDIWSALAVAVTYAEQLRAAA